MHRYILAALIVLAVSIPAEAKRYRHRTSRTSKISSCTSGICQAPSVTKTVVKEVTKSKGYQAFCELEAADLAARGMVGHIRRAPRGRMVGTGVSSSKEKIHTCVGCGPVLAHAAAQGKDGRWYHVRVFSR
jgi:hypothetical protein